MARMDETPRQQREITFRYIATTRQGNPVKGSIKATSEIAAERLLITQGYIPEHVEAAPSMFSLEEALPSLFRIQPRDVIVFSRQMATLLRSGISLLPAMEILQGQIASSRAFNTILGSIVNDLGAGSSFSQAVTKHPKAFDEIYCRSIAVGEETGSLETVLHQMADYIERQQGLTQRIKKALTYPIMVMSAGVGVAILMITVVMPQMMGMFTAMSVELPLPTRILIGITEIFQNYTLYIVVGAAVLFAVGLWM
ncbi:MAG: type II secretion system F family protein, partial [Dehalococcoidia bacterium]|nr:type II secretion system F family protein [Dehalococcoidia bacterium]